MKNVHDHLDSLGRLHTGAVADELIRRYSKRVASRENVLKDIHTCESLQDRKT